MNLAGKHRKIVCVLLVIILILPFINISYADGKFDVRAKSAILLDFNSGEIIYEKNHHDKLPPASITKIMTLILTMESLEQGKIKLDDEVTISSNASGMGGSQVYLEEGETQTVENLIKALCIRSANDASVALAEHIAGSEELFVNMMNKKAKELGMNNTSFMNSTGLPNESHYTTAFDISIMSKELMKYPKVHEWLTTYMMDIKVGKKKDVTQSMVNTNRLIKDYQGANGIKTGSTNEAGYCLSASAKRGNLQLICVVLGSETSKIRFEESKKLFDYGFANYDSYLIGKKGDILGKISVHKGNKPYIEAILEKDAYILIPKGSSNKVEKEIVLPEYKDAPIDKGEQIGELILKINGKDADKIKIISKEAVEKASFIDMFRKMFRSLLNNE